MKSDFDLIQHHFPENQDITIYPISDVHLGASEHMEQEWAAFRDRLLGEPNSYIILGGDLINNCTRSSVSNIFEETMRPREQKKMMVEMLSPLRDKILCAVTGNHERRSTKDADDDPTYDIMCKLDLEDLYRENLAFMKIHIGNREGGGNMNPSYTFAVTHGSGGGILTGSAVNRNERFAYVIDGLDVFVVVHTHKPTISGPSKIVIDSRNNKVTFKPFFVINMTSWLHFGGYAARKMLLPSSYHPQKILLNGREKRIEVTMG